MGADFAYIGSAFIATHEARAQDAYKQAIVDSNSDDIVYSNLFTGVHGNYLAPSIRAAGLDPDNLPESDPSKMNFGGDAKKAWKDIWGCGQAWCHQRRDQHRRSWWANCAANTKRPRTPEAVSLRAFQPAKAGWGPLFVVPRWLWLCGLHASSAPRRVDRQGVLDGAV